MAFDRIGDALETGLRLMVARLSENLTSRGSIASGELGESITYKIAPPRRGKWSGVITMLDYWEFVDEGRKPGKRPPVQKMVEYLSYPAVRDRMTFGREDLFDFGKLESIAYAMAKKIGEKGTKGNKFATDVFESDLIDDIGKRVANAIEEDFDNVADDIQRIMVS